VNEDQPPPCSQVALGNGTCFRSFASLGANASASKAVQLSRLRSQVQLGSEEQIVHCIWEVLRRVSPARLRRIATIARRKPLRNEENLARVRILHLAAGGETIHVHITAIRIVWTEHVARFSRNSLGCWVLRRAVGSASRCRIWRW